MTRKLALLLVVFSMLPAAAQRRRAVRSGPPPSAQCAIVTGTAAVTITRDEGRTLTPSAQTLRPIAYTYGLTPLIHETNTEPNTVMAWHGDDLLISTDAGCSWRVEATIPGWDFPPRLVAARGGRVYAWSDNRRFLIRWDSRGPVQLKQPADFVGLAVDPTNGDRVRAGSSEGMIWESRDAGETWTQIGILENQLPYRFAFDPKDLEHIVAGTVSNGAFVSRNGGRTWTRSPSFGAGTANVFEVLISPVSSSRVWAMGINLLEADANAPSHGRHIYVSSDGGTTYTPVIDEREGVKLVNGPIMAAHPTNADVLYFVFGTHTFGYGTDLFRFDRSTGALTVAHNSHDDINAIAFSPTDPSVMYLGLEAED
jgi:photosystem II stability/assembly factor-like uncharacterized protein